MADTQFQSCTACTGGRVHCKMIQNAICPGISQDAHSLYSSNRNRPSVTQPLKSVRKGPCVWCSTQWVLVYINLSSEDFNPIRLTETPYHVGILLIGKHPWHHSRNNLTRGPVEHCDNTKLTDQRKRLHQHNTALRK